MVFEKERIISHDGDGDLGRVVDVDRERERDMNKKDRKMDK